MKIREIDENDFIFLTKDDIAKEQLRSLLLDRKSDLIQNKNAFYFIVKEVLDYITQTNSQNELKNISECVLSQKKEVLK